MGQQHIGHRIRETRKTRRMTVQQLATAVNVSVSSVEKWERGDRTPPPGMVVHLARALHVGPDHLHGQPYWNGAETADQVQAVIPDLRRVLLTYDNPDDLMVPARPLRVLATEMDQVARLRQDGQYVPMGTLLPGLLAELTHVALTARGEEQLRAYWWLARGYRATNSLAHKLGYHDLSLTAIERVRWAAGRSGDNLMMVTAAYLRAGAMIRVGSFGSARRVLTGLVDEVERLAPEGAMSDEQIAVQGAALLKLAILEARDGNADACTSRLREASAAAGMLGRDTEHYEMSFGPANVRIHEVAALIDTGDNEQALARLREWGEDMDRPEWTPPGHLAGERSSHHFIDVAAARLAVGDRAGAHRDLLAARKLAPNHARFHPTTRTTAAALVRQERHADDSLAGLARWAGV
ncbi:helix-turn-helix transcriptional regulator [Streptomyces sp. G1]|uniref:helix-turn-helix domain-containing protein n=1 Tax=Streptomyces sp. G1 TaxID=361572 RepID=UPI002030DA82|nr:helix-turn-helix transcriptional regulator [Streptomyces sp. G1]MCM1964819.1 helix-turn-helix domain-containing protein [Streptomyces sp. G1]